MTYETKHATATADATVAYINCDLTAVHKALRGKPSLTASVAARLEYASSKRVAKAFLAYVAGNPSLFDK